MRQFALPWSGLRRKFGADSAAASSSSADGRFHDVDSAVNSYDHVEIDFSEPRAATPPPPPLSARSSAANFEPATIKSATAAPLQQSLPPPLQQQTFTIEHAGGESNLTGNKTAKPHSKVSPVAHMHQKLNFIPHGQRETLNTQFLGTLPGVLKLAEIVSANSARLVANSLAFR